LQVFQASKETGHLPGYSLHLQQARESCSILLNKAGTNWSNPNENEIKYSYWPTIHSCSIHAACFWEDGIKEEINLKYSVFLPSECTWCIETSDTPHHGKHRDKVNWKSIPHLTCAHVENNINQVSKLGSLKMSK
jgi:hypothetical protein